jgi:LEA14-like dessication related protein
MSRLGSRRGPLIAVAAAIALALAGCPAVPRRLERPRLEVGAVGRVGDDGIVLDVAMRATNPNDVPVQLRAADWELSMAGDGTVLWRGRAPLAAQVPPGGTVVVSFSVRLPDEAAAAAAAQRAAGHRGYHLGGAVHTESARGDAALWFDVAGWLP